MSSSTETVSDPRASLASSLLVQSPPGQISAVYSDLKALLISESTSDPTTTSNQFSIAAKPHLKTYNTQQLTTVNVEKESVGIISDASSVVGRQNRYRLPSRNLTFAFNHLDNSVSDLKSYKPNQEAEKIRSSIDASISSYVKDHYPGGVSSVFTVIKPPLSATSETIAPKEAEESSIVGTKEDQEGGDDPVESVEASEAVEKDTEVKEAVEREQESKGEERNSEDEYQGSDGDVKFVIHVVGSKNNLNNFWAGRWRSTFVYDPSSNTLTSSILIRVHYFEGGNVQLSTSSNPQPINLNSSSSDIASLSREISRSVEKVENDCHSKIANQIEEMREKGFKSLRRQLPMTKQKMDWDKALNYKLKNELSR